MKVNLVLGHFLDTKIELIDPLLDRMTYIAQLIYSESNMAETHAWLTVDQVKWRCSKLGFVVVDFVQTCVWYLFFGVVFKVWWIAASVAAKGKYKGQH